MKEDSSDKHHTVPGGSRAEPREYFDRCVSVTAAAVKLTDNITLLTCSTEPYQPGTSFTLTAAEYCSERVCLSVCLSVYLASATDCIV